MANLKQRTAGFDNTLFALDQKSAYRQIRNYLAGRHIGATRDDALLQEVIKALFCKLYIQRRFATSVSSSSQSPNALAACYQKAFTKVRRLLPATFETNEELLLDAESIAYVDRQFEQEDITDASQDP